MLDRAAEPQMERKTAIHPEEPVIRLDIYAGAERRGEGARRAVQ